MPFLSKNLCSSYLFCCLAANASAILLIGSWQDTDKGDTRGVKRWRDGQTPPTGDHKGNKAAHHTAPPPSPLQMVMGFFFSCRYRFSRISTGYSIDFMGEQY